MKNKIIYLWKKVLYLLGIYKKGLVDDGIDLCKRKRFLEIRKHLEGIDIDKDLIEIYAKRYSGTAEEEAIRAQTLRVKREMQRVREHRLASLKRIEECLLGLRKDLKQKINMSEEEICNFTKIISSIVNDNL